MNTNSADLMPPRILVVDDERQIHASIRLRLARDYELVCCHDAREALARLDHDRFDLCFADIHMPHMNGLAFIAAAQTRDPALGYVVISAFDTDDNLRRTIPLQVYDFISKPLPERAGFEHRIPEWVDRTRQRRREQSLAQQSASIAGDLGSARLERDVELVASETARDALLQTANLLTTIHAHLVTATASLATRARADSSLAHLARNLDEARKTADAAIAVAEGFFDSAYGNRDTSPALVETGIRHAVSIVTQMYQTEADNKAVDLASIDAPLPVRGLSGIDFLLLLVPTIGAAFAIAPANTTVRIETAMLSRLDAILREPRTKDYLWLNRKHSVSSQPGVAIDVSVATPAFSRDQAGAWLNGEYQPLAALTARGLIHGVQKCKGLLGLAIQPAADRFRLLLALPT